MNDQDYTGNILGTARSARRWLESIAVDGNVSVFAELDLLTLIRVAIHNKGLHAHLSNGYLYWTSWSPFVTFAAKVE